MTVKTRLTLKRSHYFCFHFNDTLGSSTGHFIGYKNNSTIKKRIIFQGYHLEDESKALWKTCRNKRTIKQKIGGN